MKHIIFGGNGFTGHHRASRLIAEGAEVVICDMEQSDVTIYSNAKFIKVDLRDAETVNKVPVEPEDLVYHLAAVQYHLPVPKTRRQEYFDEVNVNGTARVLEHLRKKDCTRLIYFSTDMVYGLPERCPVDPTHSRRPLGPYGESKRKSEELCWSYRNSGFNITIFRPRLIIGPGRLGVLSKLFRLVARSRPVPLIGSGSNRYQMISVFDCVAAAMQAVHKGVPNVEYNLGSKNPPTARELLRELIARVGSRSVLVSTPAFMIKGVLEGLDRFGLTLLYREQFSIADYDYVVDTSKTEQELGWSPQYNDRDMIYQAFLEFKRS